MCVWEKEQSPRMSLESYFEGRQTREDLQEGLNDLRDHVFAEIRNGLRSPPPILTVLTQEFSYGPLSLATLWISGSLWTSLAWISLWISLAWISPLFHEHPPWLWDIF